MATCPRCRRRFADDVDRCSDHDVALLPDWARAVGGDELEPGTEFGDYRITRTLGAGGHGIVYAAEHQSDERQVAIKVLSRRFMGDPDAVSRFVTEARAVAMIGHPNIIDIFELGELDSGLHYQVMELLEGQSLKELLAEQGRLELGEAVPLLCGLADALDAAHAVGVAHRDLKPANIFVVKEEDQPPLAKLVDFGIAKLLGGEAVAHHTATGAAIGTPRYMSPEQWRSEPIDQRADVYGFGAVVHEMLTGRPAFEGESLHSLLLGHLQRPVPAMSSIQPQLPKQLDGPVLRMLSKDAELRTGTAGQAFNDLVAAANAAGIECGVEIPPVPSTLRLGSAPPVVRPRPEHADPSPSAPPTPRRPSKAVAWARRLTGAPEDKSDDDGGSAED